MNIANEELNVVRHLTVTEDANQISKLATSSDLCLTIFISNCINDPECEVNDWFSYQTYKMVDNVYTKNLNNILSVIFYYFDLL